MADEEEGVDNEEGAAAPPGESSGEKPEKDDKGKGGKKTWEEKQQEQIRKKKAQFMPWGSDPCVKIRLKYGKLPDSTLYENKGSKFPWFEQPYKVENRKREQEEKAERAKQREYCDNEEKFKEIVDRNKALIEQLSNRSRLRRIFYASREQGDNETFEHFVERKERKRRRKEIMRKEEELDRQRRGEYEDEGPDQKKKKKDKKETTNVDGEGAEEGSAEGKGEGQESGEGEDEGEEEGEGEVGESGEEGEPKRGEVEVKKPDVDEKESEGGMKEKKKKDVKEIKKKETAKDKWPGQYPVTITEDFIMILQMIIEAEYDTKPKTKKKKHKPPPSKKEKIVKEFTSFLNVLFTANEMMKKKDQENDDRSRVTGDMLSGTGSGSPPVPISSIVSEEPDGETVGVEDGEEVAEEEAAAPEE